MGRPALTVRIRYIQRMKQARRPTVRSVATSGWGRAVAAALLLAVCSLLSNLTTSAQLDGHANIVLAIRLVFSKAFNSGTAWAGLAIVAGWLVGRTSRAALAGVLCCELALVAHYGLGNLLGAMDHSIWWQNKSWFIGALVLGAPLGACGALARRRGAAGLITRLLIPLGAVVEPFLQGMLAPPQAMPWPYRLSSGISGILLLAFGLVTGYLVVQRWRSTRPAPRTA